MPRLPRDQIIHELTMIHVNHMHALFRDGEQYPDKDQVDLPYVATLLLGEYSKMYALLSNEPKMDELVYEYLSRPTRHSD